MSPLWVPPSLEAEYADQRRAHTAELMAGLELTEKLKHWNRELKKIDPYLQLVKASEATNLPGLRPGYYHILRTPPDSVPMIEIWEGPEGEFREPESGIFRMLEDSDMWNDRVRQAKARRQKELRKARERAEEREREDRIEEWVDRAKAAWETSISMSKTTRPWTQTAKARRG